MSEADPAQFRQKGSRVFERVQEAKRIADERRLYSHDAPHLRGFSQIQSGIGLAEQPLNFSCNDPGWDCLLRIPWKEVQIIRFSVAQLEGETGSVREVESTHELRLAQRATYFYYVRTKDGARIHFLPSSNSIFCYEDGHKPPPLLRARWGW
ncbi:MAG: hypothetical protein ACM3WT_05180 [Bacillota bacterium]